MVSRWPCISFFFLVFFARHSRIQNLTLNMVVVDRNRDGEGGREGREDRRQGKRKERKEERKGRKRRALNIAERGEGERKRVRREEIGDGPLAVTLQWSPLSEILPPS